MTTPKSCCLIWRDLQASARPSSSLFDEEKTVNPKYENVTSAGLLVLRVGIGSLMLMHGIQKIQGFSELSGGFPDPIGLGSSLSLILAIAAEVGASILLILGAAARIAVIPLAFTMLVALFVVHAEDPWKVKELAATYLLVYASLLLTGPGRFSLDHLWWSKRSKDADRLTTEKRRPR